MTEIIRDGWFVIWFIHVPAKKCKTVKTLIGRWWGKGRGTEHGAVRSESLILHFNYSQSIRDCSFIISFIHVPAKNANCSNLLLVVCGGKMGDSYTVKTR